MIPEQLKIDDPYEIEKKKETIGNCDEVIVISEHTKKDFLTYFPDHPVTTIYNCFEAERKKGVSLPYFLFLGKRGGYKNFVPALKTLLLDPRFNDYLFKVVGGEVIQEEERSIFDHPRVEKCGILSPKEVETVIREAAALLFPSTYEGFGFPVLEAFCYGVPVLACASTSIVEVAGNYPLFDPNSPQTMGETLFELLHERQKWVEYGHKRSELFTRKKMIDQLTHLYQRCAFPS